MTPSISLASSSLALALALSQVPAAAFSQVSSPHRLFSSTKLSYRSLHHGPDVEPLSDEERLGAEYTKMAKDMVQSYGPGDFTGYVDPHPSHVFDGGDSEMGLAGDGTFGLNQYDDTPHMARTSFARIEQVAHDMTYGNVPSTTPYSDELIQNQGIDTARAQQLENWANQREIVTTNRDTYYQDGYFSESYGYSDVHDDEPSFAHEPQPSDSYEGIVALTAPINGKAVQDIMLKNPYLGFARFRASFVGDNTSEWSVTPSDGFLKQNEETQFVIRYSPHSSGRSTAQFVIETEDFVKTWKVVGSTGELEF